MTGVLNDIIDGYHPEVLSITELLNEIYERRKRVTRLEDLKAPEIIMEIEREKYLSTIRVMMKYMNMNEIERLLEEKEKTKLQRIPRK
jgi:hypothetical protein